VKEQIKLNTEYGTQIYEPLEQNMTAKRNKTICVGTNQIKMRNWEQKYMNPYNKT
jgi:hypothetical protein